MKILVGIDASEYSKAALEYVRKHPWPTGTQVIIFSAVQVPVMLSAEMYVPSSGAVDQILDEEVKVHEALVSQAEQELRDSGFKTEGRVLRGDPREAIIRAVQEAGADLVVVGSHGRTGLTKLLMGSVASHVVAHAPCDVLVVKKGRGRG